MSLAHHPIAKTCGRLSQELTELAGNWQGKETPTDYGQVTRRGLKGRRNDCQPPRNNGLGLWIIQLSLGRLWIKLWINGRVIHRPANGVFRAVAGFDGGLATLHYPGGDRAVAGRFGPLAGHRCGRAPPPDMPIPAAGNKKPTGSNPWAGGLMGCLVSRQWVPTRRHSP